ncbi:MAG: nitrate- and nitrite sensing domain-containing protein, partial [Alphaproteobacteria bacterium]|nr:nitrate- and nitrite sensing domain-containing protein [Alphaproteobacteria bacterium]
MSYVANIKIAKKLISAVFLPIIGVLLFAGDIVLEKHSISVAMSRIHGLASQAPIISAAVNELQKERGTSIGFVSSKGQKFIERLPAQRRAADERLVAIRNLFQT